MKLLNVDISYILMKFFGNIGSRISVVYNDRKAKKAKKKNVIEKGDGPEEAVFIGIND